MTTANDLITKAFRKGRILGADQTPGASEAADALTDLNDILDELWINKVAVFHILDEQFTLVAGQNSYTMGTGGNFNTTRPVKVVPGTRFIIANNVERALTVLTDRKSWDDIPYKAASAPPQVVFADMGYPLATLYFYPTPDQAYTVYIASWARLQTLASLVTQIALPPGYNRLLWSELAITLCGEYGLSAPPDVVKINSRVRRLLEQVNYEMPILSVPAALLPKSAGQANILAGDTT